MPRQILNLCIFSISLLLLVSSCSHQKEDSTAVKQTNEKELVIYCENAMVSPILEMKSDFEKKYNCKIRLQNDCAQNLMGHISQTKKGDLFIPASSSVFQEFSKATGVELTDSVFIGYNKLVFMVKKGNPSNFDGRFSDLLENRRSIIIANPATSSLGKITQKALQANEVYDDVFNNIISLTPDSKGLIKSLKNDQAEVVVNWESNFYTQDDNSDIEAISFCAEETESVAVYAATLSCSTENDLAKEFLNYSNSKQAEVALRKYGFSKRKTIIF